MTRPDCATGTDRVREAALALGFTCDVIVNVQGDEPYVNSTHIDTVVQELNRVETTSSHVMATIATPIHDEASAMDRNVVKCVTDIKGDALYFSRALIPHSKSGTFVPGGPYLRHIGLYAYRRPFLMDQLPLLPPSFLQDMEDLEQLRILQAGYKIKVGVVESAFPGVDTPEDLERLERYQVK